MPDARAIELQSADGEAIETVAETDLRLLIEALGEQIDERGWDKGRPVELWDRLVDLVPDEPIEVECAACGDACRPHPDDPPCCSIECEKAFLGLV